MKVQEALNRLNQFPAETHVEISDFIGGSGYPCCVRTENESVVLDVVKSTMSVLDQEDFVPLKAVELRSKLESINSPEREIVASNYNGQVSNTQCIRQEKGDTLCFDIDGLL